VNGVPQYVLPTEGYVASAGQGYLDPRLVALRGGVG